MVDYPDGTLPITITVNTEIVNKVVTMPWWIRYAPNRIVFLDDFEGFMRWGASATKYAGRGVFEGSYCAKFVTPATKDEETNISMYLGAIPRSKFAIQLRWTPYAADETYFKHFGVWLGLADASSFTVAGVRYLKNDESPQNKWQYLTGLDIYADITGGSESINVTEDVIQSLYLSADFSSGVLKYDRLITSTLDLDLSTISIYDAAAIGDYYLIIYCVVATDANQVSQACIDALCLSDNEE